MKNFPLTAEIPYENPALLFKTFADEPWSFLLDSADSNRQLDDTNRYSYIAFDPFDKIIIKNGKRIDDGEMVNNPFKYLNDIISRFQLPHKPGLPLFQGGAMGYFSYDLCHYLEDVNQPQLAEESVYADLAVGLYDVIISFDHVLKKTWIVSTGFSKEMNSCRHEKARDRVEFCLNKLARNDTSVVSKYKSDIGRDVDLVSLFNEDSYSDLVKKAQNYISDGDIFEVNLSHRFKAELSLEQEDMYELYLKMREVNPSPFSGYLNLGDHQILSTSPERFLLLKDKAVSTRPIKGTAPRGKSPEEDKMISEELLRRDKDRSENIMIVDLLRNDLSKVCEPDSVKVKKLCGLETYPTVHHLVSVVEGKLKSDVTALDLLEACFPGGSITGAPKVRAMQIIYLLEPTQRGPYCGSIGYIGFNGAMDTSIVIRTLLAEGNAISYQAGGAVVLDSSPQGEYAETLAKSASIRRTLSLRNQQ